MDASKLQLFLWPVDLLSENDSILDSYSDEFPGPIWQCLNNLLDNGAQPNDLPALTALHLTHKKMDE